MNIRLAGSLDVSESMIQIAMASILLKRFIIDK